MPQLEVHHRFDRSAVRQYRRGGDCATGRLVNPLYRTTHHRRYCMLETYTGVLSGFLVTLTRALLSICRFHKCRTTDFFTREYACIALDEVSSRFVE